MKNTRYEHWLQHPNTFPELKEQLRTMSDQEIQDCFYTNLEFGTAGMRGLLGPGPNRMNMHTIRKANVAFARYIVDAGKEAMQRGVAIAYDNRHFSKEFAFESARVLAMHQITSYVFSSLRPTPELSFAVRHLQCFGGIVITASHNPKEYNGYKLYDERGCQLVPELVGKVIDHIGKIEDELELAVSLTAQQEALIHVIDQEVDLPYYEKVLGIQIHPKLSKEDLHIIFTPQHGTARVAVEEVLKQAGYRYTLVKEQAEPDPDFSNTKTPNPEEQKAYELAIEYAQREEADIVLTTDPDADRVGVVVRHNGSYQLMSGNQTGSVLIQYVLSQLQETGKLPVNPVLFNTVVTSDLGEKVARTFAVEVEKTLTGFKFIGEKIHQHEQKQDKNFVFGYEESYGYLIQPFVRDKDAVQACLIIAEAANYYKKQGKTLFDVLESLYDTFGWYEESQVSLSLAGEEGARRIAQIMSSLRADKPSAVAGTAVVKWEDYQTLTAWNGTTISTLEFPSSDVLKLYLEDGSWIAARPSGTEPKCKFYYCVVGKTGADAKEKTLRYQQAMKQIIE